MPHTAKVQCDAPLGPPQICFWEITNACNIQCIHCFNCSGDSEKDELTSHEVLRVARDLVTAGCRKVVLTGGEPLLRKDWSRISKVLASGGAHVALATNGFLIDEVLAKRVVSNGIRGVSVSIDGIGAVHDAIRKPGSFDAAIGAVKTLMRSGLFVGITTQVHRHNIDTLDDMHGLFVDLGVYMWQLQIPLPFGRLRAWEREYLIAPDELNALQGRIALLVDKGGVDVRVADNIGYFGPHEGTIRRTPSGKAHFWGGCQAGLQTICIGPTGDVRGCHALPREFAFGNVRDKGVMEIWRDKNAFAYNRKWDSALLEGACKQCPLSKRCGAGCTAMAYAVTGTIYDNPYCVRYDG